MIAEILITNWPSAITALGVTAMVGYVLLAFIKAVLTERHDTTVREVVDSEPMWKETTVTTTIDDDAIKEVLKEMGYDVAVERAATAASISAVTKAMERDYSALMKKIDEIRTPIVSTPTSPVGVFSNASEFGKSFQPVPPPTTSSGPGDACH